MLRTVRRRITILLIMSMFLQLLAGAAPVLGEDTSDLPPVEPEFVPLLAVTLFPGETTGATSATVTDYVYGNLFVNVTKEEISWPQVGDIASTAGDNLLADYETGADITAGVAAGKYLQIYDVDPEDEGLIVAFYQAELTVEDIKAVDLEEGIEEKIEEEEKPFAGLKTFGIAPMSSEGSYSLGDSVTGTLDSNGVLEISGSGPMYNYTIASHAPFYNDRNLIKKVEVKSGVTSIGEYVFYNCTSLTSVTIPDSVTSIGSEAFSNCRRLTSVTIPGSVTSIGEKAFNECTSLASVSIPNSITSIGEGAFYCCRFTSITIPDSVTSIGNFAFNYCTSLTSVRISNSDTSIGSSAFSYCSKFATLYVPATPPSVGDYAFNNCQEPRNLIIVDATGEPLTGEALTLAQNAYRAAEDGNPGNKYWYGWAIFPTPTAADFTYDFSVSPTYTGSPQDVTVSGKTGMGENTRKYNGSTTSPVNAGTYSITVDVAEGEYYFATSGLSLGTYTINKATPAVTGTVQAISNAEPGSAITTLTGVTVNGVGGPLEGSWQGTAPLSYNATQDVIMTFIPSDTTNYNNVTTTVSVTTKPAYSVTFNANGGTGDPPSQGATPENGTFTLPANPFVKEGYIFAGWNDGTNTYSSGTTYTMPAGNVIFEARWTASTYTITYNLDGGTNGANPANYNIETATITLQDATRTGYTFLGWYDAATGGSKVTEIVQGSTGDKILYARWAENTSSDSSSGDRGSFAAHEPAQERVDILINGKAESAATVTTTRNGGKTVTTVVVDDKKVEEKLEKEGSNSVVTIQLNNAADAVVVALKGQTVKSMELKDAVLEIRTGQVTYTLPASQINIDVVSEQMGRTVELKDIAVSVKISEPSEDTVKIVEDTANTNNYQIVVEPIEFEITCSSKGKTVEVSKFSAYVERMIAIPGGVDPSKITTAVILNPDGTFSHVPTVITVIDGKYYAKINSLTNSIYSLIYNPESFEDTIGHWARETIEDMASRLVVSGVGGDKFEPDRDVTRVEFASIIVRGLGIMRSGTGKDIFTDVLKDAWYYDAATIAYEYNIIAGYGNGKLGPMEKITREQAMAMTARAMKITGLDAELTEKEINQALAGYTDLDNVADYAKASAAACVKNGIITGRSKTTLAPKDNITRAEVTAIVSRLLQKSGLI
ncbi:MAG: leucine-rich repeat protein [Clostridia bacterium]|nr:leucine-rich repeat protein [Clostridia bacterium]